MAGKFKIFFVLCLVAPCLAQYEIRSQVANPDASTTTLLPDVSTTTPPPDASTTTLPTVASTTTLLPDVSTTTLLPDVSTTTPPPDASTTTLLPDVSTTTLLPDASTTTLPPDASTTTLPPGASTTTLPPDASSTTLPPDGSTTTTDVTTGGTVVTTKPQPTTASPDPCASSPCGYGSTCDPRNNENFVCLCLAGENYNNITKSCEKAKVFPGELSLTTVKYDKAMSDKRSPEFFSTANTIISELTVGFKANDNFSGATVLELLPIEQFRAAGVKATVEIIFRANAVIDDKTVNEAIADVAKCPDCQLKGATFTKMSLCDINACDETAICSDENGSFTCTCKDGYIKTDFATRLCIACPSGHETKDGKTCTTCSFGYSGFNCDESWQLVLTIVGSVLSGLLLVTLILLPVVALKSSKKSSKKSKEADIGMSQFNQPNTKAPMVTSNFSNSHTAPANGPANGFANAGIPKIPRAASNWESRTNLDMTQSNSRQNLIPSSRTSRYDDDDDTGPYAQVRPQGSLYSQARPQNNLYAQTRPQNNPYASSQGQSSTYFAQDVGRRY